MLVAPISFWGSAITGLSLISVGIYMIISSKKENNPALASAGFMFFWIGLYALTVVVPYFITPLNLTAFGVAYIFAIAMLFLALFSGTTVLNLFTKNLVTTREIFISRSLIASIGVVSVFLLCVYFTKPEITSKGVMLWHGNLVAHWLIGVTCIIYGFLWGTTFYQAAILLKDPYTRFKLLILSADGFMLGTAGFLIHTSIGPTQNIVGLGLAVTAGVLTLLMFFLREKVFASLKGDRAHK